MGADVADLQGPLQVAEGERAVAETPPLVRREPLPPRATGVAEAVAQVPGPEDAGIVDALEEVGVDQRVRRGVDLQLHVADNLAPEIHDQVRVAVGLRVDRRPIVVIV